LDGYPLISAEYAENVAGGLMNKLRMPIRHR
jgi:hypothetical protein